jgi:hypothetical protein
MTEDKDDADERSCVPRRSSSSVVDQLIRTDALVELIIVFCPPVTVMASLARVCKAVAAVVRTRCSANGNTLIQRYWYMLHYHLVWDAPERDKARRALQFALTKDNAKKNWHSRYRDELAAHLARTMRGAGCSNNRVNEAKNFSPPVILSTALVTAAVAGDDANSSVKREDLLKEREDAAFVGHCVDAGIAPEHFLGTSAGPLTGSLSRMEYKKDARQGKRAGKHAKGKAAAWSGWDDDGNYDY